MYLDCNNENLKLLVALALLALLLAGCSSDPEPKGNLDAQAVAEVTQQYINAQQNGNWEEMCPLLDNPSRKALQKDAGSSRAADCAKALAGAPQQSQRKLQASAKGLLVIRSAAKGDQGEALVKIPGGEKVVQLTKQSGSWKVSLVS